MADRAVVSAAVAQIGPVMVMGERSSDGVCVADRLVVQRSSKYEARVAE